MRGARWLVSLLALGRSHTCGATTAGDVHCWGANASGQLGDGTTTDSPAPTRARTP